jgi:hypothetical protein
LWNIVKSYHGDTHNDEATSEDDNEDLEFTTNAMLAVRQKWCLHKWFAREWQPSRVAEVSQSSLLMYQEDAGVGGPEADEARFSSLDRLKKRKVAIENCCCV